MGINPYSSSESVARRLMHSEQRHEAEIYVQLLVTVKERAAWIVGDEIELELRAALAEAGPSLYRGIDSLAPFTAPDSLVLTRSLADFITTTSGLRFSVHTAVRCRLC
jgi:hypothetical protein